MTSEVLIIGGGVIGLSVARALHRKGVRDITVVESGRIGCEASFAAAGLLAPQAEADHADFFFEFCSESNALFPQVAEELLEETGIDIELDSSGTFYVAFTETDSAEIARRFEWQSAAGLRIEEMSAAELRRAEPLLSENVREGLFFPDDRQVENRILLRSLIKYAELGGIGIIENTRIDGLTIREGKVEQIEAAGRKFAARWIVIATGAWTSLIRTGQGLVSRFGIKPIRGQMASFNSERRLFSRVIYSPRGYIVPRRSGSILAGATVEDVGFDKQVTESGIEQVRINASEMFPGVIELRMAETWGGLRPYTIQDGLPVLGAIPEAANLLIAAGHYRNGILLSPLTANIVADKIAENVNSKYLDIFGVRRFEVPGNSAAGKPASV